jgi:predicted  nucleic acid-binding Zn-ribbon protein
MQNNELMLEIQRCLGLVEQDNACKKLLYKDAGPYLQELGKSTAALFVEADEVALSKLDLQVKSKEEEVSQLTSEMSRSEDDFVRAESIYDAAKKGVSGSQGNLNGAHSWYNRAHSKLSNDQAVANALWGSFLNAGAGTKWAYNNNIDTLRQAQANVASNCLVYSSSPGAYVRDPVCEQGLKSKIIAWDAYAIIQDSVAKSQENMNQAVNNMQYWRNTFNNDSNELMAAQKELDRAKDQKLLFEEAIKSTNIEIGSLQLEAGRLKDLRASENLRLEANKMLESLNFYMQKSNNAEAIDVSASDAAEEISIEMVDTIREEF